MLKATASFSTETDQTKLLRRLMAIVLETAGATRGALVLEDGQGGDWCVELAGSIDQADSSSYGDGATTGTTADDGWPSGGTVVGRPSRKTHPAP